MAVEDVLLNAKKLQEEKKAADEEKERLRIEKEKTNPDALVEIEMNAEQEAAFLKKRFNVDSIEDIVIKTKADPTLTEEEKAKLEVERQKRILTTGLEKEWFTQKEYDEYQSLKGADKIEIARKKFIEDNKENLGDDAEEIFDSTFHLNEEDEIPGEGETVVPNVTKKASIAHLNRMADDYIATTFKNVLGAEKKLEQFEDLNRTEKTNVGTVAKAIAEIPETLEIIIGENETEIDGRKVKVPEVMNYKITDKDRTDVAAIFLSDKNLIGRKNLTGEDVRANALLHIQTKNMQSIIQEAISKVLAEREENYRRGQKGLPPIREDGRTEEVVSAGEQLVNRIKTGNNK